jgi:hypothetical protein
MKEKKYFKHALALTPCTHSQGACLGHASFKGDVASPRLAWRYLAERLSASWQIIKMLNNSMYDIPIDMLNQRAESRDIN